HGWGVAGPSCRGTKDRTTDEPRWRRSSGSPSMSSSEPVTTSSTAWWPASSSLRIDPGRYAFWVVGARDDELYRMVAGIVELAHRPREVRVFDRRDHYGQVHSFLVLFPRDRY